MHSSSRAGHPNRKSVVSGTAAQTHQNLTGDEYSRGAATKTRNSETVGVIGVSSKLRGGTGGGLAGTSLSSKINATLLDGAVNAPTNNSDRNLQFQKLNALHQKSSHL